MWQAACKDFKSLAALRILGGAAEACADPAFMLITSMWCKFRNIVRSVTLLLIFPRYETAATHSDWAMVLCKWSWDCWRGLIRVCDWAYQRRASLVEIRVSDHRVSPDSFSRSAFRIYSKPSVQCSLLSMGHCDVLRPPRLTGHRQVSFESRAKIDC